MCAHTCIHLYSTLTAHTTFSLSAFNPTSLSLKADYGNHLIRRIDLTSGLVSTLAGTSGVTGSSNGLGTAAAFNNPLYVSMDAAGTFTLVVSFETVYGVQLFALAPE